MTYPLMGRARCSEGTPQSICPPLGSGEAPGGSDPSVENWGMNKYKGKCLGWGQCRGVAQSEWCYCREHSAWVKAQKQEAAQSVGGVERGAAVAGTQGLERRGFGGDEEAVVSWCRTQPATCSCLDLVLGKWAATEDFRLRSDMTRYEYW